MVIICNVSKIENKKRDFFLRETQPLATTFCNEAFINKLVENASPLTGYIHSDLPRAFILPNGGDWEGKDRQSINRFPWAVFLCAAACEKSCKGPKKSKPQPSALFSAFHSAWRTRHLSGLHYVLKCTKLKTASFKFLVEKLHKILLMEMSSKYSWKTEWKLAEVLTLSGISHSKASKWGEKLVFVVQNKNKH